MIITGIAISKCLGSINNEVSDIKLVFKIKILKWVMDVSYLPI